MAYRSLIITLFLFMLTAGGLYPSYSSGGGYISKYIKNNTVSENFRVPSGLERAVDFWIDIYSKYDVDQVVIHDTEYFVIYDVIDVSDLDDIKDFSQEIKDQIIESRIDVVKNRYRNMLSEIHELGTDGGYKLNGEHKEVYKKFSGISSKDKFLEASRSGRIRAQKGQMSSFKEGVHNSQAYMDKMEAIFIEHGLPVELARIPYVESYFNPKAVSYRNAAGIWQFMKGTGKEYLKVTSLYDERMDPLASTYAAAKLLKQSHNYLWENWPLAVTSYNHGRFGMKKASAAVGSRDLVEIIKNYNSNTFGFASKNFYAEFLAALFIDLNKNSFFDDMDDIKRTGYYSIQLIKPLKVSKVEALLGVDKDEIKIYNPSISNRAIADDHVLPKGARIRISENGLKKLISKTGNKRGISGYVKFI